MCHPPDCSGTAVCQPWEEAEWWGGRIPVWGNSGRGRYKQPATANGVKQWHSCPVTGHHGRKVQLGKRKWMPHWRIRQVAKQTSIQIPDGMKRRRENRISDALGISRSLIYTSSGISGRIYLLVLFNKVDMPPGCSRTWFAINNRNYELGGNSLKHLKIVKMHNERD